MQTERHLACGWKALTCVLFLTGACDQRAALETKASDDAGVQAAEVESACDKRAALGICVDHTKAAFATGEDFVRSACTGTAGRYMERACPASERVGSCTFGSGQIRSYYAAGGHTYSAEEARRDCEQSKGKWSVPGRASGEL